MRAGTPITGRAVDRGGPRRYPPPAWRSTSSIAPGIAWAPSTYTAWAPTWTTWSSPTTARSSPGSGFTVEPGLYWPGRFGVRLEVSAILRPDGPLVTTESQTDLALV